MHKKLLLLSSSKAGDTGYLEHARQPIKTHLDGKSLLFIPYAGVGISAQDYTAKVKHALAPAQIDVVGIESFDDPKEALRSAQAIAVGGGNTFVLLTTLYKLGLLDIVKQRAHAGVPYIGWSAGSNLAGLSIRTTNDMPIVEPPSFRALGLVPFQLNPHYSDYHPPGFHGETRDQRLAEFMHVDSHTAVVAIQEGTALQLEDNKLRLLGDKAGYIFQRGEKRTIASGADCSFLL